MAETHREETHTVIGNRELLARMDRDVRSGQLSHAYILDGRKGSGRHTLAYHLVAAIACENRPGREYAGYADPLTRDEDQMGFFDSPEPLLPIPSEEPSPDAPLPCLTCPSCRKVMEGKCPDVHVIGRGGRASIGVEAIRFLRSDVLIPPNELGMKVYILEDTESMTVQAQNALLLTLEEPPVYVLFLLLCDGAENLLETIRSRAPTLRTQPIPDEQLRKYLRARRCSLSEEDMEAVLLRADGCIGQALTLADVRSVKPILKQREICDAFMGLMAARRYDGLPAVLARFGNKREGAMELLALLRLATRDLVLLRQGDRVRLKFYTDRAVAEELACRFTTRSLLQLSAALDRASDSLVGNGNLRLTLMHMAVELGA